MFKKIETNTIQNKNTYIACKLDESIPKGIILYYPMVSIIETSTKDKKVKKLFLDSSFFSFSKNLNYLNIRFLSGLSGLVVLFVLTEGVASEFVRPLTRPVRPQPLSLTRHYSQIKLSQLKIQNSEKFGNNINDKKSPLTTKSRCQTFADNGINAIYATMSSTQVFLGDNLI